MQIQMRLVLKQQKIQVASALAIVQTEIQRAQTHLAEWNSIGDMRIKQVLHLLRVSRYVQER